MLITTKQAEQDAIIGVAKEMCAAIRTAPKTKGQDFIDCCVVTGKELALLAFHMDELSTEYSMGFLARDAGNMRMSTAVVLIGVQNVRRGLGVICGFCGFKDCDECQSAGATCSFSPIDLGIAIGSAASVAADHRVDSRVMFSAGRAAMDLGFLSAECTQIIAIPLSVSGKSPYFDRK